MYKIIDELGLLAEDLAVTATASSTPVKIEGLNVGVNQFVAEIINSAVTGTVDGSNYYTATLNVSNLTGGTYSQVGNAIVLPATAGRHEIAFTSEQIEGLIAGAKWFKVTVTKTGTTATGVTVSSFITKL